MSQHCIAARPTAKPLPPCHYTIDCIVTRPQPDCPLVMIQRLYPNTTPQRPAPRLCHDTILCIVTQSTSQAVCARTIGSVVPYLSRIVAATVVVSQALLRASLAMSWPPGCAQASLLASVSRYNYCIVTQCMLKMGSSPIVACNVSFLFSFFFHHFLSSFCFHFCYWKTTKKKHFCFFFHFPINQLNLLKFILFYFSSSFTHCKTLENFLQYTNFFFHLILDYLPKIS